MKIGKNNSAYDLTYADTELLSISEQESAVVVRATGYDDAPLTIRFLKAKILPTAQEELGRVESGQIIVLKNGMNRLLLFDDDQFLMLEIEYETSEYA